MSLIEHDGKFKRKVEYITTHSASDSFGMERKIRELYWDFRCDYIVLDNRNGGELSLRNLTKQWEHPERKSSDWNSHGFTVCTDMAIQVVPKAKIDDIRATAVDPQAIPCVIPIVGLAELNSLMWLDLQKRLRDEEIDFLIEDLTLEQSIEEDIKYLSLTSEERAKMRLPYVQTEFLIHEAVNLTQTWNEGKVRLSEPRSGTKDRIVALSYGNYIMSLIENKLEKSNQGLDFDESSWYDLFL